MAATAEDAMQQPLTRMAMASRTYIVTIAPSDPSFDIEGLKEFVRHAQEIENWWNHIPLVFLITTDLDAETLSERLRPYAGKARFLMMEVNPAESEGALPERGWQWIRRRSQPTELSTVS
jgi:hypothetical protein